MTVTQRDTCLKLLGDSEFPIGYMYFPVESERIHSRLYAFFTDPRWDDMSKIGVDYVCLKYDNLLTDEGRDLINGGRDKEKE
jgi:hypothetical protein